MLHAVEAEVFWLHEPFDGPIGDGEIPLLRFNLQRVCVVVDLAYAGVGFPADQMNALRQVGEKCVLDILFNHMVHFPLDCAVLVMFMLLII